MSDLAVTVDGVELTADWVEENPRTRAAISEALPLDGEATRWGEELYFRTDVDVPLEDGQAAVPVGAIAYWPQGNALCLFWGPTPASEGDEPRAASPVNVIAILDDSEPLTQLDSDATVTISRL